MARKPLGEILLLARVIDDDQLRLALDHQEKQAKPLGQILLEMEHITSDQLNRALAEQSGAPVPMPGVPAEVPWFRRRRIPFKFQTAMLIILIILGLILPISFLIVNKQLEQEKRRILAFGTALVKTYANYSAEFVLQEDWPSLDPFIREVAKLEEVRYVQILDPSNTVKAHSDVSLMEQKYQPPAAALTVSDDPALTVIQFTDAGGRVLDFAGPITYQQKHIGTIHLGISEKNMAKDARELRLYILILSGLGIAIGLGIAVFAGTLISQPIGAIVKGTHEISLGNFDHRIAPRMNDELGDLARAFNEMADGLKKKEIIQASFGRYVTPEIVDLILRNPEQTWLKGSRKMVSVLFADIRNFTGFAEDREPEEVVSVLNQFFTMATEVILAEEGYVNKFNGDQVMAVFGAPLYHDDHAIKAVRTAIKIQSALSSWNIDREKDGKVPIRAGIGVNSGLVVAGNLGSEQKMEYTVIGDDVNLASRLTSLAGPSEIIISEKTREFVQSEVELIPLESIKVKGKKHPVMIYRVKDEHHAKV